MKRIIVLAIIGVAAWYGSKHFRELFEKPPEHLLLVHNRSSRTVERLRVGVGGRTFVKDQIGPQGQADFRFVVGRDSPFDLVWQWSDSPVESRWSGGYVSVGPIVRKHDIEIDGDGGVVYLSSQGQASVPKP